MSGKYGAPSSVFGYLSSPQEVSAIEDDTGVDDFGYEERGKESRSSNLLVNKPYQLITADTLMDSDEEEENSQASIDPSDEDPTTSLRILNLVSLLLFANAAVILPSSLLYIMTLRTSCVGIHHEIGNMDALYMSPIDEQSHTCNAEAMYLFATSLTLFAFFQWVGGPLFSLLSSFLGNKKKAVIVLALLLSALGNALYGAASNVIMILVGRSFVGLSVSSVGMCLSYISAVSPRGAKVENITNFRVFSMCGVIIAPLMSLVIAFAEPPQTSGLSFDAYTGCSYLMCAFSVFIAVCVLILVREHDDAPKSKADESLYISKASVFYLFYSFVIGFFSSLFEWMVAPLTAYRFGWDVKLISLYFFFSSVLIFPSIFIVKLLKKRNILMTIGDRFFLYVSFCLMPSAFSLLYLAFQFHFPQGAADTDSLAISGGFGDVTASVLLSLGTLILFMSFTFGTASHGAALSSILPPESRDQMLSLCAVITSVGRMVGPLFGAFAYVYLSFEPDVLFGILTDVSGLSLVLCLVLWQSLRPGSYMDHVNTSYQEAEMDRVEEKYGDE